LQFVFMPLLESIWQYVPVGSLIARSVGTFAICPGSIDICMALCRSNPADSGVALVGRVATSDSLCTYMLSAMSGVVVSLVHSVIDIISWFNSWSCLWMSVEAWYCRLCCVPVRVFVAGCSRLHRMLHGWQTLSVLKYYPDSRCFSLWR